MDKEVDEGYMWKDYLFLFMSDKYLCGRIL
jgi:hypothetical protein